MFARAPAWLGVTSFSWHIHYRGFDYSYSGDSNWTNCNSVRQQSVSMSDCMCFQKQQFNIFNVYIWYLAFCSELTTGESWNGLVQMKIFFHCYLCMTSSSSPACMPNKITLNGFDEEEAFWGKVWLHAFSIKWIGKWVSVGTNMRWAFGKRKHLFGKVEGLHKMDSRLNVTKSSRNSFWVIFQSHCLESLSSPMLEEVWHASIASPKSNDENWAKPLSKCEGYPGRSQNNKKSI